VESIVEEVNEEKRKFEKQQRKLEIIEKLPQLSTLCPSLSDPSCSLEMEGAFLKVLYSFIFCFHSKSSRFWFCSNRKVKVEVGGSSGNQTVKGTSERTVFLFSDLIAWVKEKDKEKKGIYKLDGAVLIERVRVVDVSGYQDVLQNSFEIHDTSLPSTSSCVIVLSAKNLTAKRDWVQMIKRLNRDFLLKKMNAG
jgi:hypothetical protein